MTSSDKIVFRLAPNQYTHVLDNNTNVSRIEVGPQVLIRREHEEITHKKPIDMVVIPPSYYCVIRNPVMRNPETNEVVCDKYGQAKLCNGDKEFRFEQDPFPLYPGEILEKVPAKMPVVLTKQALRLCALVDFTDDDGKSHISGEEWYFKGPGTYKPRKEVEQRNIVKATNILKNTALRVKAVRDCVDVYGCTRVTGEEWLIRETGDYLPSVDETIIKSVNSITLNETQAIHLKSNISHVDQFGITRKAGEEWLLTHKRIDTYIPDVSEEVIKHMQPIMLNAKNYCMVLNPITSDGKCQVGLRKVIQGPCSFFLHPGEELEGGIKKVHQLGENDGLILRCVDVMENRKIGEMWLLRGPCEYVPTEAVEIVHMRKAIALAENEGIYVKNMNNGTVRSVIGGNYMLNEEEELWKKELSPDVISLLHIDPLAERSTHRVSSPQESVTRDESRVVSYRIPHNAACQIYDYKLKKSRVVFGPELAILEPDEQFTLLSLSEGVPKKPNARKALCLLLGPDYFEEMFTIETADHARLSLRVSLNWQFSIEDKADDEKKKIFALPDFVGDVCKVVASRIRGAVSSIPFDHFHKNSADIIHLAVFGNSKEGKTNQSLVFPQNYLTITSLDIISLEPVDQKTRDALQRTVQLAIEITTNAQEASAKHEAIRLKQEAEGRQVRQRLIDNLAAEKERKELIAQRVQNAELEACGQAIADAKSQVQAARIEREAAVDQAKLEVEAMKIKVTQEIEQIKMSREIELNYLSEKNRIEVERIQKQADIETNKFKEQIAALGKETLVAMANAGPEMKVKMLRALGLQSTLITDGNTPINLFNTAAGLISQQYEQQPREKKIRRIEEQAAPEDEQE